MANALQSSSFSGLGTFTYTAPSTDTYTIQVTSTIPTLITTSGTQQSALVITMNDNGTPFYTGAAGNRGATSSINATAGDIITVVMSSSNQAVDAQPNAVRSTITISEGI